jgi:hypothetical protein
MGKTTDERRILTMPETLEILVKRIDWLETMMQQIQEQLSRLTEVLLPQSQEPKHFKTGAEVIAYYAIDKRPFAKAFHIQSVH